MELDIRMARGGPIDVNTYVVGMKGADECVLIDPGAPFELVKTQVSGRRVTAALLTHGHFDHIFGLRPWLDRGAKLYMHRLDAPMLASPEMNLSSLFGSEPLQLPAPDVLLEDGDALMQAGIPFTVLHTPGHTPGSVCYLTGKTLFSGDTMFYASCGRVDLPGGDAGQMRRSLSRLRALDAEIVVYPGHDRKTKIAWERGRAV